MKRKNIRTKSYAIYSLLSIPSYVSHGSVDGQKRKAKTVFKLKFYSKHLKLRFRWHVLWPVSSNEKKRKREEKKRKKERREEIVILCATCVHKCELRYTIEA